MSRRRADPVAAHDLSAERAVLGAVLLTPAALSLAETVVSGEHFFREAHRAIWEALVTLQAQQVPADLITVVDALTVAGQLDAAGGPAYVASLTDGMPDHVNVAGWATVVREKARWRALGAAVVGLQTLIDLGHGVAADAAQIAVQTVTEAVGATSALPVDVSAGVEAYVRDLTDGLTTPIRTGYADFDALVGGLWKADLALVAARPAVGKSSWVLGAAEYMARHGVATGLFSLEMTAAQLIARLVSGVSRVSADRVRRGMATEAELGRVSTAAAALREAAMPLWIDTTSGSTVEIRAAARRWKRARGLGAIVVDYLQLVRTATHAESRQVEMAYVATELKAMAKELNVPVLAACQLNRAPEGRKDKRPRASDMRESGALEQVADLVVLLYRDDPQDVTPETQGIAEIIVAKNRSGPCGVLRMVFAEHLARFENLAVNHEPTVI